MILHLETLRVLQLQYPNALPHTIASAFTNAESLLVGILKPDLLAPGFNPPELYGAAILRVHSVLAKKAADRNAASNACWTLLTPHLRGQP